MEKNNPINRTVSLEQLVGRLKREDSNYAQLSRIMQMMYWIFIPVFLIMAYRHFTDSGDYLLLIGDGCKILAILIFALFFGKYYREYKYVDYAVPTLTMLKNAAYRYKPFHGRMLWIVLAVGLLDAGLYTTGFGSSNFLLSQVLFIGSILLAILAGLLLWYIKYKPLRDDALRLIEDIEGN